MRYIIIFVVVLFCGVITLVRKNQVIVKYNSFYKRVVYVSRIKPVINNWSLVFNSVMVIMLLSTFTSFIISAGDHEVHWLNYIFVFITTTGDEGYDNVIRLLNHIVSDDWA